MSALMGPIEASQLAERRRVKTYFETLRSPSPRPERPRPLSPFNPRRILAERYAIEGPPPAPYDHGPKLERPPLIPERKWKTISREVAVKHGVKFDDMLSPKRWRELVVARNECYWRIQRETTMSLPHIGRCFNRDHTTILWGIKQHKKRIAAGTAL